jgi:hypothetical protein
VRTAYGYTADFPIQRSIRQGDPLAPLLFVCFMDFFFFFFQFKILHANTTVLISKNDMVPIPPNVTLWSHENKIEEKHIEKNEDKIQS